MVMDVRPIATAEDYAWALAEVEAYFDNEPDLGTPESDRFNVLSALIENYEAMHWQIEAPDPLSAIREAMDRLSLGQKDFARLIGSKSRASEILNGKRGLTMEQAALLHSQWHIPAAVLLQPMKTRALV